jgi:putative transcription factor
MDDNEGIWDAVTILRKNNKQIKKNNVGTNIRTGNTESVKKQVGRGGEATKAFKLDQETDGGRHEKVSRNIRTIIMNARNSKGFTQSQFAMRCQIKPETIKSYENGTAIPDNAILGKMEKQLGIKLRGKNIGEPLNKNKK